MDPNEELLNALTSRMGGIPEEYVREFADWFGLLRDKMAESGLDPIEVNRQILHAWDTQGLGPMLQGGGAADAEGLGDVAELLGVRLEGALEAEVPDLALKDLLGQVKAARKENVEELRGHIDNLGAEPDETMEAILQQLAGDLPPDAEIPLPKPEDLPPEVAAAMESPEMKAALEELEKEEADLSPEELLDKVKEAKASMKASMGEQLAALGVAPGPVLGAVFGESAEEQEAAQDQIQEGFDLPDGAQIPEGPVQGMAEEPEEEVPPEKLLEDIQKAKEDMKNELATHMENLGAEPGPVLDVLFGETPAVREAAMKKIQDKFGKNVPGLET